MDSPCKGHCTFNLRIKDSSEVPIDLYQYNFTSERGQSPYNNKITLKLVGPNMSIKIVIQYWYIAVSICTLNLIYYTMFI